VLLYLGRLSALEYSIFRFGVCRIQLWCPIDTSLSGYPESWEPI
jgi:hypothetical protein